MTGKSHSELSARIKELGRSTGGNLASHPEYKQIVSELKRRGIKTFGALDKAVAAEQTGPKGGTFAVTATGRKVYKRD